MNAGRPLDCHAIKAAVVERARELGAAAVRISPAFADEASRERMREAFARGDFATWGYDDAYAARATDPREILPGAQTVVCLAVPYATAPASKRDVRRGRVSNYAWSADYHRRMRVMLGEVAAVIDDAAGSCVTAIACDTRPLAERAFAARAGVGWIGKHTNLIVPGAGSFAFLGEVVTTLPLPADVPLKKSCGSCARCIEACPTRALRGDYTIDASRCIADLTQRTDPIPREMRPLIGTWVWGCDLCQLVCPPTQRAGTVLDENSLPMDDGVAEPNLVALLQLRSGEFKRRFAKTAMGWRGAAVLRRNAAVALGNVKDRSTVSALADALERDPHPMVRGHAAWALGRIGSPSAVSALRRRDEVEEDESVREEIAAALGGLEGCRPR
jgi:epoxyqueuosine reductase